MVVNVLVSGIIALILIVVTVGSGLAMIARAEQNSMEEASEPGDQATVKQSLLS